MSEKRMKAIRLTRKIKKVRDVCTVVARTLQAVYYAVRLWE
ncbi:hypothetical protein ACFVW1_41540 [Streptomyces olivochromogenes]